MFGLLIKVKNYTINRNSDTVYDECRNVINTTAATTNVLINCDKFNYFLLYNSSEVYTGLINIL